MRLFRVLVAAVFGLTAHAAVIVFDFDTDSFGTTTQFTDSVNGLSATFSSPDDPGGFVVQPTMFQALAGNVLGDPGPAGQNDIPLTIDFSSPLSAITLVFATADFGQPSPFTLTAYSGNAQVGTTSAAGIVPAGFIFPEGEIAFAGPAFDRVVLSTPAPDFAIDQVAAVTTPEPAAEWIVGLGLVALGASRRKKNRARFMTLAGLLTGSLLALSRHAAAQNVLPFPAPSASTVPPSGDVNPYGVSFVPSTVPTDGLLQHGGILVSNFNNNQNLQGTGTSIVQVSAQGQTTLFYASAATKGMTAALGILSNGIVIAGYLPTLDGTSNTASAGGLVFLDRHGITLVNFKGSILGPWGMAVNDRGNGSAQLFVSDVLTGNVSRVDLSYAANGESVSVVDTVVLGSFGHRSDPAALELGPSGLALDTIHNILYVASETDNTIYSLPSNAAASQGSGTIVYQDSTHLHGPLDMVLAPNGHLLVANSDGSNADPNQPSEIVEFTPAGQFIAQYSVDPNNGGAFGLGIQSIGWGTIKVAAVDDNMNIIRVWTTVAQ